MPSLILKPLLPRTESYLVPIQLPVTPSVYLPSSSAPFPPTCSQQKQNNSRGAKRVRIAPKVAMLDGHKHGQESPDREFSFKTPIKSNSHLTSSTPSKPPSNGALESWKVTPVAKGSQNILDFSPIRTPGGPTVNPRHDYSTFSFSSTPFKDLLLFNSPRELLTSAPSRVTRPAELPSECLRSSCFRELLQAGGTTPANRSVTEGLVLDTMNDSLSKILVDISFSGLDDDDLDMANISWSEFIPLLK
ncbi:forkhead box protein M1-like [Archocentrus centrarchus]|uniref:forkhead box protein M1-like n=1 Tax=Archocentrus centrarchus TaxID=63155 RepID=UPI0011EA10B2|nr:forkhead box protein M1-like [Archocentrus centrarchus]